MKKKVLAWVLLLALGLAGGAVAGGGDWQEDGLGLTLRAPADYTVTDLSNGQAYVAELKGEGAEEGIIYRMEATAADDLDGAGLDALNQEALCGLLERAGGDSNYECYFDEIAAQPYMVAEKEGGAALLALTVHNGYACVFSVKSAQGQLPQAAKDGLMGILAEAVYR